MRSFNLIFSRHQNQKHSVIFHVSTFSVKIFVTVNLKVSSFCPSALVWTCFGSEAWNWIRIFIWTHHHWNLIPSRQLSYFILFYFILFYFIFFILFYFISYYFISYYFTLFYFISSYFLPFVSLVPTVLKFPSTCSIMWLCRFWAVYDINILKTNNVSGC